ncbi:hypothetical protein NDU88_004733 [Pleurodeles waltl]|uniref:Uncharacterized protein n=1 Tax=Pleurodeles waltl TaxID=8319 RepID=A0AAV7T8L0_PLEWA|nr:hypothetical protein NDU88_004721 [Pleurodeles waltl]KAJ1172891.1 hypothetical protein NDU88_004733 [Pleurodeles waltl]
MMKNYPLSLEGIQGLHGSPIDRETAREANNQLRPADLQSGAAETACEAPIEACTARTTTRTLGRGSSGLRW